MVARPSVKILFRSSLSMLNQLLSVCHGYLQDGMHIVVKYISINYIYKLCVDLECAAGSLLSLRRGSSILSLDWRASCCRFSLYLSPPPLSLDKILLSPVLSEAVHFLLSNPSYSTMSLF